MKKKFKNAVIVTILTLASTISYATQKEIFDIGGVTIRLPPPAQFTAIPTSVPDFIEAEHWIIPSNCLVTLYMPNENSKNAKPEYLRKIIVQTY